MITRLGKRSINPPYLNKEWESIKEMEEWNYRKSEGKNQEKKGHHVQQYSSTKLKFVWKE